MDIGKLLQQSREETAKRILGLEPETAKKLLHWLVLHNQPPGLDMHLRGREYLEEEFLKTL